MSENIPVGPNCMPEMPKTLPVLEDPQDNCDHGVPEHTVCSDCLFERIKALEEQVKIVQEAEDEHMTELCKLFKWAESHYPVVEFSQFGSQNLKAITSAFELISRVETKEAGMEAELKKECNARFEFESKLHHSGVKAATRAKETMRFIANLNDAIENEPRDPGHMCF